MMYQEGWGWMWLALPMMVVMAVVMVWMMRPSAHGGTHQAGGPEDELDRRLAAGELTVEEYRAVREELRRH